MHLKESEGLLDVLQHKIGCVYLSDLHDANQRLKLSAAVAAIPAEAYQPREWRDAAKYIMRGDCPETSSHAAKEYLLQFLRSA